MFSDSDFSPSPVLMICLCTDRTSGDQKRIPSLSQANVGGVGSQGSGGFGSTNHTVLGKTVRVHVSCVAVPALCHRAIKHLRMHILYPCPYDGTKLRPP